MHMCRVLLLNTGPVWQIFMSDFFPNSVSKSTGVFGIQENVNFLILHLSCSDFSWGAHNRDDIFQSMLNNNTQ
jgi:hypothetical protein